MTDVKACLKNFGKLRFDALNPQFDVFKAKMKKCRESVEQVLMTPLLKNKNWYRLKGTNFCFRKSDFQFELHRQDYLNQ